jgi:hypothetical protein
LPPSSCYLDKHRQRIGQATAATVRRPEGRIEAALRGTSIASVHGVLTIAIRRAQDVEQESTGKALPVICDSAAQWPQ